MNRMNPAASHLCLLGRSLFCGIGLLVGTTPVFALVLDDFTQGGLTALQATNYSGKTVQQSGLPPAFTLGGERSVYVGSTALATVSIDPIKGRYHFTADTGYGYFSLGWGSVTPLNLNLASGNNGFQFDFVDTTPNMTFSLSVKSAGTWVNYFLGYDLAQALGGKTFGTLTIPFSKFAGANFAAVQAIELGAARVRQGFQLGIDSVSVVPEPAVGALLIIAPVLLPACRKRPCSFAR